MNIKQSIAILAFVFGGIFSLQAQTETVPSVSVKNINGETVDFLKSIEPGKITIISFWATWCAPCREEMPSLDRLQVDSMLINLKVFAINIGKENKRIICVKYYIQG